MPFVAAPVMIPDAIQPILSRSARSRTFSARQVQRAKMILLAADKNTFCFEERRAFMPLPQKQTYTIDYIYSLPEGQRAELIDGQVYDMAPPNFRHQKLVHQFDKLIGNYIDSHGGACEVIPAPFAVFLTEDDQNYVEPDISVICDKDKLDDHGCNGAPDWIIEIASPSTERMDYGIKLFKYRTAGVREYWIVNPMKRMVNVFDLEHDEKSKGYVFDDDIPSCIYQDLTINVADLLA